MSTSSPALSRPVVPPGLGLFIGVLAVPTAPIFIRYARLARANSLTIAALAPFALTRCRAEYRQLSPRDFCIALTGGAFPGAHFAAIFVDPMAYVWVALVLAMAMLGEMVTPVIVWARP